MKPTFVRELNEERTIKTVLTATVEQHHEEHFIDKINHRNSIRVLQRVVAYIMRFDLRKLGKKGSKTVKNRALDILLTTDELQKSLTIIIKHCQQQAFPDEIEKVKKGKAEKTRFSKFVPIIDADGVLRVGD